MLAETTGMRLAFVAFSSSKQHCRGSKPCASSQRLIMNYQPQQTSSQGKVEMQRETRFYGRRLSRGGVTFSGPVSILDKKETRAPH